ncbi:Hypothetical protein A7982_07445 [Minicystis rosea]|nr:Hypothetical protein A7982_07445 [Minicystis rosea]
MRADERFIGHPYTPMTRCLDEIDPRVIDRTEGSRFFDVDGIHDPEHRRRAGTRTTCCSSSTRSSPATPRPSAPSAISPACVRAAAR